jgi:C4-dicarboxylate transporter, DctQ subunit
MLRRLDQLEEWIIACLLGAATLLIFASVVHRFASGVSFLFPLARRIDLSWAQELCIFMVVWMAKFGAAYGVRTGIHVGVDVLVNLLRPDWRRLMVLFSMFCGALFTGAVGTLGVNLVAKIYSTDQMSADMEVPMWIVYLAVPLGSYLMCFRFLQVAWIYFRTGEIPHRDHTYVEGVDAAPAPPDAAR